MSATKAETNLEIAERTFVYGTVDDYIDAVIRLTTEEHARLIAFMRGYQARVREEGEL